MNARPQTRHVVVLGLFVLFYADDLAYVGTVLRALRARQAEPGRGEYPIWSIRPKRT